MDTKQYIYRHKLEIQKKLSLLINELKKRADEHDISKLKEPEYSGWVKMDKEPRYEYGSKEYFEKIKKYKWLFDLHYRKNRHHPEYWQGFFQDMDLIDLLEMICDWISYRDDLTYQEATEVIEKQCTRFGFPQLMRELILNTVKNYFARPPTVFDELGIKQPPIEDVDFTKF